MSNMVVYNDGEIELKVSVDEETVWLNRNQISDLFERDVKTIGKHINNVFDDGELEKVSVVANFATTARDGKNYHVEYYNLDVIISVGYRVKSPKGVKFRQWATSVLKQYIQNGYAINTHKITEQRLSALENDVATIKSHIKNNTIELKQGIFFNGQIFDAYALLSDLINSAKSSIVLIDNYIDASILTLFSKNPHVTCTLYTSNISKQLELDIQKYTKQYGNLSVKTTKNFHDRFLICDECQTKFRNRHIFLKISSYFRLLKEFYMAKSALRLTAIVKEGYAVVYKGGKFIKDDSFKRRMLLAQQEAKQKGRGLWSGATKKIMEGME